MHVLIIIKAHTKQLFYHFDQVESIGLLLKLNLLWHIN